MTTPPYLSCVVTAFNEGETARIAIESLLAQSFGDFEMLLVDDGADEETRSVLRSYQDSRIIHLRQANDGLSSARNRGLQHASGEYVCFLDADDMRPAWALKRMAARARQTQADCLFMRGRLSDARQSSLAFYDDAIVDRLPAQSVAVNNQHNPSLEALMLMEPQSANKLIRRNFLERHHIRFPVGLFFEDMLVHVAIVANLQSFATITEPCFSYFKRYGRPQITGSSGTNRFDALAMANMTLELFAASPRFASSKLRLCLMLGLFRLIRWSELSISHRYRKDFRMTAMFIVANMHDRYHESLAEAESSAWLQLPRWQQALSYINELKNEQRVLTTN